METLKELLLEKGSKVNLQFTKAEKDFYIQEAGFTDEEIEVFDLRSRGYSVTAISMKLGEMHGKYYSQGTIESRIRSIKDKILRLL